MQANREIYFADPRLRMTIAGRLFVRAGIYIGYLVWIAATGTFILSDIGWLRALGAFFALVLFDRLIHLGQADRPFFEMPKAGRVNLARYTEPKAFGALECAYDRSLVAKRDFCLELVRQLVSFSDIEEGLRRLDVEPKEFKGKLEEFLSESRRTAGGKAVKSEVLERVEKIAPLAFGQAVDVGRSFIGAGDIFSVMPLLDNVWITRLFKVFEIEAGDLSRALIFSTAGRLGFLKRLPIVLGGFVASSHRRIRHRVMNRAWTARPTPVLDRFSRDLTDLARHERIGFLVGHEGEFQRMVDTLARPINPNVLLVGEAGIGKETIISHLAFKLVKDEVPVPLFDKRLVELGLTSLVAGAAPEELHQRLQKIVEEILAAGNVILYIPEMHNLVRTSGTAYLSAAEALMPIIINDAFPIVGASYPREFKQLIEPRSDFAGAFEVIRVQEITPAEAEKILAYESLLLEKEHRITISFGAIKKSVVLAQKYFHDKFLPSSAEEILKSALVETKRRREKFLGPEQVMLAVEEKVKVPIREAGAAETEKLLNLEAIIHRRLVNQEEAVRAVADSLRQYRSGLSRPGGPIASFLFVGPTGVGKTELAKNLARIQFGSEKDMVRFDMTEYQDKQSFYRFIGSPDGTTRGALTDAVLQKPYSLILLDEFEKAYPDILNLFLQVFDDGRLTDNLGRVVDFQNTIIIATSNAHSDIINDSLTKGESMASIAEYLKRRLIDVFRPELLNRFSKIVIFRNLEPKELISIAKINLGDLAELLTEQGIVIEFDPAAVETVARIGYEPAFGARPLRRVIEERIRSPLATAILEKKVKRGSHIRLSVKGEKEFEFTEIG